MQFKVIGGVVFREGEHCDCTQCKRLVSRVAHSLYKQMGLREKTSDYGKEHYEHTLSLVRAILHHMES